MSYPKFVIALGEIGAEGLVRIPLAKLGRWFKGKLKFSIAREDMAAIVRNFRKKKNGEVVIDYDHATEYSAGSGQAVPAAGWLKAVEDAPDQNGILWGLAEFTERALQMIQAKEYKYLSPVLNWGARDKDTGEPQGLTITSVALTNQPVLEEMPAIALSEAGWVEDSTEQHEEVKVPIKKIALADRAAGTVRAIFEDGTETVLSVEGLQPEPKVIALSEVKRTKDGLYDFASLDGSCAVAGEVVRAMAVQNEIDAALKAGKITPAQRPAMEKLALSDLEAFRSFVQNQKPQVPLGEQGFAGEGDGVALSDLDKVEAEIKKHAQAKAAELKIPYGQALRIALSEHPELAERKRRLMREE